MMVNVIPLSRTQREPPTLSSLALADLARSGLTAADADKLGIKHVVTPFGLSDDYQIPYFDFDGNPIMDRTCDGKPIEFVRYKHLTPLKDGRKYDQPKGTTVHLYLPRLLPYSWRIAARDASVVLYIVEGEKKAAAMAKCGFATIGIGGVSCWRANGRPLAEWDNFVMKGRTVKIVFDSDIVDKIPVQQEESKLALALSAMGAVSVLRKRLPQRLWK